MATKSVQSLVEDIRLISEANHEIVETVRALVKQTFKCSSEEVKYGGILFSSEVQFCGVFAYKEHVSVEFGAGAKITDEIGFLEGSGKGRRHLKIRSVAEIKSKKLAEYLLLAHKAASGV
ncbi:DUF1801 domain-containing protein [Paucibacter sp. AS339]|uniref:DUF1801 domain-containing protein n=1 Tax=Paucibacter hankyongi TaxID=3133434 RepID=UPI0030AD9402